MRSHLLLPSGTVAPSSLFAGSYVRYLTFAMSRKESMYTINKLGGNCLNIHLTTSWAIIILKFPGPNRIIILHVGNEGVRMRASQVVNTAISADDCATLEVSQSLQRSDMSPVLAIYKRYLKAFYNARALAPADKYLPTLSVPYINLAMVGRGYCAPEDRDEFTRQTLHGGIDEILQSKTPINIEDLLTSEDSGRPVRFILVEGPPGIGKSTFAWEVCRRWDEIESLRDYHTVVLLKLREKWVLNATSLSELLRYPLFPDFSFEIAIKFIPTQGKNLLLVLDGFDEVSHSFHENSVIKSILCRQLLPECTIILTTRPVAKATLESICQPRVDKHVEIIGFTEEERVRYITEVFSKKPELQVNFLKYMFLVPHIKSMMYIPLNCSIIAQVYYESQSNHHLAIPRTRTQLYKALAHSLLVRHMKMKESNNFEYTSALPEGLDEESMKNFKTLAKFALDTYHKGKSRKVTFLKEDIPEGLVHFGFMNESTEMYAGKGVEQTFSFLHLSLQEYLAAWHLADSFSIEFQVAYHRLALETRPDNSVRQQEAIQCYYKGDNKEEKAVILSLLDQQRSSLVEPAIFLAGITGWRCQSEDDRNHWEMYLSHDIAQVSEPSVLLQSLYEAQNPSLLPHYYATDSNGDRRMILIGSSFEFPRGTQFRTSYDCYALSYCLARSSDDFCVSIGISRDDQVTLVETFSKGLYDHCNSTTPRFIKLTLHQYTESVQNSNNCLFWLARGNFWSEVKEIKFIFKSSVRSDCVYKLLKKLVNIQFIFIKGISWEWFSALRSLSNHELKGFHIKIEQIAQRKYNIAKRVCCTTITPERFPVIKRPLVSYHSEFDCNRTTAIIDIPSFIIRCDARHSINIGINSLLNCVQTCNEITRMDLSNISRETMAGVHNILLHCPSLTKLELKRTRLGYDGIIHICRALRNNTTLRHLVIQDIQLPPSREKRAYGLIKFTTFLSMERVPLPDKTTCTDFLLELNNILKDNTTLKTMKIQSGLFFPLSAGEDGEYCQWTGLGPLQQFNVGAVARGMSPNLRRSFSSSDLTQPQTKLFWDKWFAMRGPRLEIDFKIVFSHKKKKGKRLFSLTSFTAPDTEVLQSFSGLDARLKDFLGISRIHWHMERLKETYWGMLGELKHLINNLPRSVFSMWEEM